MENEKKIKIVFFIPTLGGGGAERNIINFIKNFDKEKFSISLVLGEKKGELISEVPKDISVIDLGTVNSLKIFFRLIKYFQTTEADIFISTFPRFNIISLLAKFFSKPKTKIIVVEQSTISLLPLVAKTFIDRIISRFCLPYFVKLIYPMADAIVCVSQGVADDLSKFIPDQKNKIKVIYNPITNDRIYRMAKEPVGHPWFSDSKIPIVLSVGRLIGAKDYPNFLQAAKMVLQKRTARFVVLGDGAQKIKLENMAYKLGISENVAFLGFQKNPYKYMNKADILVLSSFKEGFGNVIVEAMACGTPVISTNCKSGPSEIIKNKENGILVPIRDPKALSKAILELLNNSPLRQKFSRNGRKRAKLFSVEKSVREYENLFQKIASKNY